MLRISLPKLRSGQHNGQGLQQRLPIRYYLVGLSLLVCFIVVWTSNAGSTASCVRPHSNSVSEFGWNEIEGDHYPSNGHRPQFGCENATFVILVRNHELSALVTTLEEMEIRFNHAYHYPYVFLNDQPFSEEFKRITAKIVSSKVQYGLIPSEHWVQPSSIDEERATESRERMVEKGVDYAGSVAYRNMCRFNSGFFFRHELLQQYRYYWRIEPGVTFFCDINDDPFAFMKEHGKIYGFTIALYEFNETIPTLWNVTKEFIQKYPQYVAEDNSMRFLSDNDGEGYNLCHYWSNFEIADMDFWRSEAYMKYFEFLDEKGGFYYERWGDAPVHSLAVSLFARKDQIHFFEDIGYRHKPLQHCPQGLSHSKGRCSCTGQNNFDYDGYSCFNRFDRLFADRRWSWG